MLRQNQSKKTSRARLFVEALEDRVLLNADDNLVVTHTGDSGAGSLRAAIDHANATANIDRTGDGVADPDPITFNLAADDPGHVYYADDGIAGQIALANVTQTSEADDANIGDIDPDWAHSWWMLAPQSALPFITEAVSIDGYTQTGAAANSNPVGQWLNTILRIEINGANAGDVPTGMLRLRTDGSVIRGLAINRTTGPKIRLENFSDIPNGNTTIAGNFIGPDISGSEVFAAPKPAGFVSDFHGVFVRGSNSNVIGGTTAADRNLISGNIGAEFATPPAGVQIGNSSSNNRIEGNLIGTDRTGTVALGNGDEGVSLENASGNTVGGISANAQNVISGNTVGVRLQSRDNLVQNNLIGADVTGTTALGNTEFGVLIGLNSGDNQVIENTIAFNGGELSGGGIVVASGDNVGNGNLLSRNAVFSNIGLGIDLDNDRETANDVPPESDPPDQDTGPNALQNFPILNSVTDTGGGTEIQGTLQSTPDSNFRIEFFANSRRDTDAGRGDSSGRFGEGEMFVGFLDVSTDANGVVNFTANLAALPDGLPYVTATATDVTIDENGPRNNTSEFSAVAVLGGPSFVVTNTNDSGLGSLREAIFSANLTPDQQTITFDIPADDPRHFYYRDDGVAGQVTFANIAVTSEADDANIVDIDPDWAHSWFSVQPTSNLPEIADTVIIDGYTQPGSSKNTVAAPGGLDSILKVEIDGSNTTGSGLKITGFESPNTSVEGLVINRAAEHGVDIGTDVVEIVGNSIGTDVSGTLDLGNGGAGVNVFDSVVIHIGSNAPQDRNLITGNNENGIVLTESVAIKVHGNLIGIIRDGQTVLPNTGTGVVVESSAVVQIGGLEDGASNRIGHNSPVVNVDASPFDTFKGELDAIKNLTKEIKGLQQEASEAWLGGVSHMGNDLEFIKIELRRKKKALKNLRDSISFAIEIIRFVSASQTKHSVEQTPIDHGSDGPTPNDPGDADTGPNAGQNAPAIATASNNSPTTVTGTLHTRPNQTYRIDFYASETNPNLFGDIDEYLGFIEVTTDADGNAGYTFTADVEIPIGHYISSTATELIDHDDNPSTPLVGFSTSEFSSSIQVGDEPQTYDYGDAPLSYLTILGLDGPRHLATGVTLGTERDADADAQLPLNGLSDDNTNTGSADDEDGVQFVGGINLIAGEAKPIDVDIQNSDGTARLYAWIDFNGDGDFLDAGEQVADGTGQFANLGDGTITLNVDVPNTEFSGESHARFRVSTDENLTFFRQASDGEVEDYRITIGVQPPPENGIHGRKWHDANANGQHDEGEPYLNGWTMQLLDETGTVVDEQVTHNHPLTGEAGHYWFDAEPGQYRVVEVLQDGWRQSSPDPVLAERAFDLDLEFGFYTSGTSWENWGGLGEKWFVAANLPSRRFAGLDQWFYITPDGRVFQWNEVSGPGQLTGHEVAKLDPSFHTDLDKVLKAVLEVEDETTQITGIDFGNYQVGIHGRKFEDANANGQHDDGEAYLNGWTIELLDATTGDVLATQVTHNNPATNEPGHYWFTTLNGQPLPDGTYAIREVLQDGWITTTPIGAPDVAVAQRAFDLDQERGFFTNGNLWENWGGLGEKWFLSSEPSARFPGSQQWYYITPTGEVFRWDEVSGSGALRGDRVDVLDPSYHAHLGKLLDAQVPALGNAHVVEVNKEQFFHTGLDFGNHVRD